MIEAFYGAATAIVVGFLVYIFRSRDQRPAPASWTEFDPVRRTEVGWQLLPVTFTDPEKWRRITGDLDGCPEKFRNYEDELSHLYQKSQLELLWYLAKLEAQPPATLGELEAGLDETGFSRTPAHLFAKEDWSNRS